MRKCHVANIAPGRAAEMPNLKRVPEVYIDVPNLHLHGATMLYRWLAVIMIGTLLGACGSSTAPDNPCGSAMAQVRQTYGPPANVTTPSATREDWYYPPGTVAPIPPNDNGSFDMIFDWSTGRCTTFSEQG